MGLCVIAAVRVLVFAAGFPLFNPVDEAEHADVVLKYARGYWPGQKVEVFDRETQHLQRLYFTAEYRVPPEKMPGGVYPRPLWQSPGALEAFARSAPTYPPRFNHEAHAAPPYYALAALWYRLGGLLGLGGGGQIYWIRFLNAGLVAGLVWCAYLACRDWFPGRPEMRLGVPLLLAFFPQDVFYTINADVVSPLLFAAALLLLRPWYERDRPGWLVSGALGALAGLALLVKFTNVALPLVLGGAALLKLRRQWDDRRRDAVVACLAAGLAALLPIAICFGRNWALYGDPSGTQFKVALVGYGRRAPALWLEHPIFTPGGMWTFWSDLMHTFWRGELVWRYQVLTTPALDALYAVSSTVMLVAAAAAALVAARGRAPDGQPLPGVRPMLWASVIVSVLTLAGLSVWFDFRSSFAPSEANPYFTAGRLIAGALLPFAILYVEGLAFLMRRVAPVAGTLAALALTCGIVTVAEAVITAPVFANPYNWFHLP